MKFIQEPIANLYKNLSPEIKPFIEKALNSILTAKKRGGKIVVVTGSGPNIHEGVTTLMAELIHQGVIDGVTTSSAVVAHEMAGVLEEIKRVDGIQLGLNPELLPRGNGFEISCLPAEILNSLQQEMSIDLALIEKANQLPGEVIIKAAGNMAYPLGLRTEKLAREILVSSQKQGLPFETVAGAGADPRTMLGAAYLKGIPMLVTLPQLIGGGMVGLAIGDSISIAKRTALIARMLGNADVIIESAVALTQEIHDGPFETYTGHGIWAGWENVPTYSLEGKTLIRIDLDPNLKKAWDFEKHSGVVQKAIAQGLPKSKLMSIPFRMEMSGFARLEQSLPIVADIGVIWPILAWCLAQELDLKLNFMSYPQQTPEGQAMRKWIVENVLPIDKRKLSL